MKTVPLKEKVVLQDTPTVLPGRRGWAIAWMILILLVINWADKAVIGLAAHPIMAEFGLSRAEFGGIMSSTFFFFGIAAVVVGYLTRWVSTTKLLIIMTLLWSISMVPALIVPAVWTLYFARIVLGGAEGPTAGVAMHGVHKWFIQKDRAIPTAMLNFGAASGLMFLGPLLALIITNYGWRASFACLVILGLVWIIIWHFVGREGPLNIHGEDYDTAVARPSSTSQIVAEDDSLSVWKVLLSRTFIGCLVAGWGSYWGIITAVAWLPTMLHSHFGFNLDFIGLLTSVPPILGGIGMVVYPWLTQKAIDAGRSIRIYRGVVTGAVILIGGICAVITPFAGRSVGGIVLAFIGLGVPCGVFSMIYLPVARISLVKHRGIAFGVLVGVATSAGLVAPTVIGIVMDASTSLTGKYDNVFFATAAVEILTGLIAMLLIQPVKDGQRIGLKLSALKK